MDAIFITLITIFIFMLVSFIINQLFANNGLIDIAWGLGFIVISIVLKANFESNLAEAKLVNLLVIIWGFRLATQILLRNIRNKFTEDWRYKNWRQEWIERGSLYYYLRTFVQVNMLQGIFMFCISIPLIIANTNDLLTVEYNSVLVVIGSAIWGIGFFFESIGDLQLYLFKSKVKNKGKLMQSGLWSLTRHPNYFGEVTMWWGIFFITLVFQNGFIAVISPLAITFSILKLSGIPMLEKKYEGRKDFEEYKSKTPAFFPKIV